MSEGFGKWGGGGGGGRLLRERERVPPSLHKSVRSVRVLMLETIRKKKKRFSSMLLYVHRDHRTIRNGEPRTVTSTFTQLLNSEEEKRGRQNSILPGLQRQAETDCYVLGMSRIS